jgi:hypothetical protein
MLIFRDSFIDGAKHMKRISWLLAILFIVWFMMLTGLWIIVKVIIPISREGPLSIFIDAAKVALSALLSLLWLWLWREMATRYFWHRLRKNTKKT